MQAIINRGNAKEAGEVQNQVGAVMRRQRVYESFSSPLALRHLDLSIATATINSPDHFTRISKFAGSQFILSFSLNEVRNLDNFFIAFNRAFAVNALIVASMQTTEDIKASILTAGKRPTKYLAYFFFFITHRVLPKLSPFTLWCYTKMYPATCVGVSRAELMGRLMQAGFEILEYTNLDGRSTLAVKKIRDAEPAANASYWPLFKMERVGAAGKLIHVYKFRTMYPYSEYVQAYMRKMHGLDAGGKFKDDFRVTSWGKWLRRYWLDELPMVVNLVKGDLKLVGVRPLSQQYFDMYPEDVKELRKNAKPGLVPPFYADMPKTFEEIVDSEKKYLLQYKQNGARTDMKYLLLILRNILTRFARSK
jgi:lipopolysaccharide/colanic/teichoic acid biosynthesis glycosyltransferase